MRPIASKFPESQAFASMATAGVAVNSDPNSGVGYYVYLYGDYQPFGHAGWDGKCPVGTPIYAMAAGTVLWVGWSDDLPGDDSAAGWASRWLLYKHFPGIVTVIKHNGWISVTAHQSNNDAVHVGMKVKEGQLIGLSGDTSSRTSRLAPHVHVEALVDMSYSTGGGLIYGRTNPTKFFGTATPAATIVKKVSEVPKYTRVTAPAAHRRLAKGKAWPLIDPTGKLNLNLAVNGLGHYDVDLFLQGTSLPVGETLSVQFVLIPTGGKPSAYFKQEIAGTVDGTFEGVARFKMPVLSAARVEAIITSSVESAYIDHYAAEVYTFVK